MDPAWREEPWSRDTGLGKSPDIHYETLTVEQMLEIPVQDWLAKDAYVAMWVKDNMFPHAFALAAGWELEYVTVLFRWMKTGESRDQLALFPVEPPTTKFGMGRHTRGGGCEECWLFKRGRGLPVLRHDIRREFFAERREHSRKPDEVAGWLVDLYGDVPRLEMFARTRRIGWSVFGNQIDKFAPPKPLPNNFLEGATDGFAE